MWLYRLQSNICTTTRFFVYAKNADVKSSERIFLATAIVVSHFLPKFYILPLWLVLIVASHKMAGHYKRIRRGGCVLHSQTMFLPRFRSSNEEIVDQSIWLGIYYLNIKHCCIGNRVINNLSLMDYLRKLSYSFIRHVRILLSECSLDLIHAKFNTSIRIKEVKVCPASVRIWHHTIESEKVICRYSVTREAKSGALFGKENVWKPRGQASCVLC